MRWHAPPASSSSHLIFTLPVEVQMPKLHDMAAEAVWDVSWKLLQQLLVQLMQQQMTDFHGMREF
jgi:hypothetical protein